MKNRRVCPKCGGTDILRVEGKAGAYGSGNNIMTGMTIFSAVWVDWENKVISFSEEKGFEELRFPTHEEKFRFAIDRGNEGFGIQ